MMDDMKRLFVRTGGGARGVQLHTGAWLAMHECGIEATALSGTSAGGLVSLADATGLPVEHFYDKVSDFTTADVKDPRFLWRLRAAFKTIPSIHAPKTIRNTIAATLPISRSRLSKPCHVWGVDEQTFEKVDLCEPELGMTIHDMALATMSAPMFLPAFEFNGRRFIDGGVRANCPMPEMWQDEYDEVWIFVAANREDKHRGRDLISNMQRAATIMMWDQTADVLESHHVIGGQASGSLHVVMFPPPAGRSVGIFDFDPYAIEDGYNTTMQYIRHNRIKEVSHAV